MPKKSVSKPSCIYRRAGSDTVYARDRHGRYNCFTIKDGKVRKLPAGIRTLGPIYGRVNFRNNVRFTGRTRNQSRLRDVFNQTALQQRLQSLWLDLPSALEASRRQTNQGMDGVTIARTGSKKSATEYVNWYRQRNSRSGLAVGARWEWCHLIAHSMGGANGGTNIVAARKGNNSEQLAIESALQMYRREETFQIQVTCASIDGDEGRHIGNVIRYHIRCTRGGEDFIYHLDCMNAPDPSEIHYYGLLGSIANWANKKLAALSAQIHGNAVSSSDQRLIKEYLEEDE